MEAVSLFPEPETPSLRPAIAWSITVLLALTLLPWFTGGREAVASLISAFSLVLAAVLLWRQPSVRQVSRGWALWLALGLLGWGLLSLIWTANRFLTVTWVVYLAMPILAAILTAQLAERPQHRRRLVRLYLIAAWIFTIYGIGLYLTGSFNRFTSTIYWPNPAAAYLLPALLVGVQASLRSGRQGWWYRAFTVAIFTGFWLAESRGATLVLILLLGIMLLYQSQKRRYCINLLFIVILSYLLSILCLQIRSQGFHQTSAVAPVSRLAPADNQGSTSISDRINYLVSSFDIWESAPLLGTGAGTFQAVHPQHQIRVISASASAHNQYVETFADLGLPGGLLMIGLVLGLAGLVIRVRHDPELLVLGLGLIGLLLHMGLDIDGRYPAILMLAGVLVGLIYRPQTTTRRTGRMTWVVATAVLAVPVVSMYQSSVAVSAAQVHEGNLDYGLAAESYNAAHAGLVYDPDTVNAEGIDYYTLASDVGGTLQTGPAPSNLLPPAEQATRRLDATLALNRAHEAEKLDPRDGQHPFLAARAEILLGQTGAAERDLHAAIKLDPFDAPQYYLVLGQLQSQEGRWADTVYTTTTAIKLYPPDVLANRSMDTSLAGTVQQLYELRGLARQQRGDLVGALSDRQTAGRMGGATN